MPTDEQLARFDEISKDWPELEPLPDVEKDGEVVGKIKW